MAAMSAGSDLAVLAHRVGTIEDAVQAARADAKEQRGDIRALTGAVADLGKSVAVLAERVAALAGHKGERVAQEPQPEPQGGEQQRNPHVVPAAVGGASAAAVAAIYEAARAIMRAVGN